MRKTASSVILHAQLNIPPRLTLYFQLMSGSEAVCKKDENLELKKLESLELCKCESLKLWKWGMAEV